MSRKSLKISLFVVFLSIIIGVFVNIISKNIYLNPKSKSIKIYPSSIKSDKFDLSYRLMSSSEPTIQKFTVIIPKNDFDKLGYSNHELLIYRLNCQAYRVYLNDVYIGSLGDFEKGNSNIKNALINFPIDKHLIKDENRLTIETFSLYDIGLSYLPIIICNKSTSNSIFNWFNLLIYTLNPMSISFGIIGFIILTTYYFLNKKNKNYYFYFSLSMLFWVFSLPEFMVIYNIPFSYIIYKKLMLLFAYSATSCLSIALYKLFNNKLNKILAYITLITIIIICIFSNDLISFKHCYRFSNFILPVNVLSWIYITQKKFKECDIAKILCISGYLCLIFLIFNVIFIYKKNLSIINTPLLYTACLTSSAIIMVFLDYINKEKEIENASKLHIELYEKSITDAMTGFYNHHYITSVIKQLSPNYYIIIVDIDDFKSVNDTYGHLIGDKAIQYISDTIKSVADDNTILGRYGGDEFLMICLHADIDICINIIKKINVAINLFPFTVNEKIIPLTFSSGFYKVVEMESIDDIISKVDKALYISKNNGKNQFTIFNNTL